MVKVSNKRRKAERAEMAALGKGKSHAQAERVEQTVLKGKSTHKRKR